MGRRARMSRTWLGVDEKVSVGEGDRRGKKGSRCRKSTEKEPDVKRNLYLLLAIAGAVLPYLFFIRLIVPPASINVWLEQMYGTPAAAGITNDLLVSSLVFWVWMHGEAKARGMKRWWAFVLVNLGIGLSCALPLFLYFREGKAATALDA